MSRTPISRRRLVAGTGAALVTVAIPAGVLEAVAAEMPSTAGLAAFPTVFDPAAFVADLIAAGYRLTIIQPVWCGLEGEDLRPSFHITPVGGSGFGRPYLDVMTRWSDALDACPNHVEEVGRYGLGRLEAGR